VTHVAVTTVLNKNRTGTRREKGRLRGGRSPARFVRWRAGQKGPTGSVLCHWFFVREGGGGRGLCNLGGKTLPRRGRPLILKTVVRVE